MPTNSTSQQLSDLTRDLPDAASATTFFARLTETQPAAAKKLARDQGLLADVLALAAWSPLLATTLLQHPAYFAWLARERAAARIKTHEELDESLARFALTNSQLEPHVVLSRFRRRELLRIYLHDLRRANTLVETTEELSNLADAILAYALNLARAEMDKRYGAPQVTDARGRAGEARFVIVALGKLGSRELNYSSDIDLLFLYSADGETSGAGARGATTNREYFVKLSEHIARTVGAQTGEGAAYRVDLRLRPYGRDGALASSCAESARYYRDKAQAWELQALIRARAAAGDAKLFNRFIAELRPRIYLPDATPESALAHVREAKTKIDREQARLSERGYNVKLGAGGIREIEFIAQALQLAYGGRDEWLQHAPHTLISIARLAERRLISEAQHTALHEAYIFLRMLEHRLQMEHGLQTHHVPVELERRALVARRMNFAPAGAMVSFNVALAQHTKNVSEIFAAVFHVEQNAATGETVGGITTAQHGDATDVANAPAQVNVAEAITKTTDFMSHAAHDLAYAAAALAPFLVASTILLAQRRAQKSGGVNAQAASRLLQRAVATSINPPRALKYLARIGASLAKTDTTAQISTAQLGNLARVCGASEGFAEMLANAPRLVTTLPLEKNAAADNAAFGVQLSNNAFGVATLPPEGGTLSAKQNAGATIVPDYATVLRAAVLAEKTLRGELAALRCAWSPLLVEIAAREIYGEFTMREATARQTALAEAALDAACLIAAREMTRRYGATDESIWHTAVLGLGRLGGGSVDYGSDLDLILVFDDALPAPDAALPHAETYRRYAEILVAALSSLTRDGFVYRVDLRLRPDGRNGATIIGAESFLQYARQRAQVWEWLAYIKLRGVRASDAALALKVEGEARRSVHERARAIAPEVLRAETLRVRARLEQEKSQARGAGATDIKYGAGGMLDIYFAVRYLQLRDNLPDEDGARTTRGTLARLHQKGYLSDDDYAALSAGYMTLRALDHALRLSLGRATRLPATDNAALAGIARTLNYPDARALLAEVKTVMPRIRAAYQHVLAA